MSFDSHGFDLDDAAYLGGKAGARSYSPVQLLFLFRLAKLLRDRQQWSRRQTGSDWRLKLISKAIYSTFCDCVELGVATEARQLFERNRSGNRA